jgi:DMSO/TMAO reductase YedYZ molybdopterin-dependent catalytic subunit
MDRAKLMAAKQRWAREGRLLVAEPGGYRRLPPGQHLVRDWPVLDLGNQPNLRPQDWSLSVGGLVRRSLRWNWDDLMRQRQTESVSDIHCVTAWSRYDNRWQGVAARTLLAAVEPLATAKFVILKSFDAYATCVPLDQFAGEDVLLATRWEGKPLSREHGGPVRLVLPKLYFWKSPKWLRHVWFTDKDAPGTWEARGYHRLGDPWKQQRYG